MASVSQGNAYVSLAGQVRVVAAPSPQKAVCRLMAWCAVGMESVSVASVCVITSDALEHSVRSVQPAQTPVYHTGKYVLFSLLLHVVPAGHTGPQPGQHLGVVIQAYINMKSVFYFFY